MKSSSSVGPEAPVAGSSGCLPPGCPDRWSSPDGCPGLLVELIAIAPWVAFGQEWCALAGRLAGPWRVAGSSKGTTTLEPSPLNPGPAKVNVRAKAGSGMLAACESSPPTSKPCSTPSRTCCSSSRTARAVHPHQPDHAATAGPARAQGRHRADRGRDLPDRPQRGLCRPGCPRAVRRGDREPDGLHLFANANRAGA